MCVIVLGEHNGAVLDLPNGIPPVLEDLKAEIKRQYGLLGSFRLQFRDARLDNDFVNLPSTSPIKHRSTVNVIQLTNESGTTPHNGPLLPLNDQMMLCPRHQTKTFFPPPHPQFQCHPQIQGHP